MHADTEPQVEIQYNQAGGEHRSVGDRQFIITYFRFPIRITAKFSFDGDTVFCILLQGRFLFFVLLTHQGPYIQQLNGYFIFTPIQFIYFC